MAKYSATPKGITVRKKAQRRYGPQRHRDAIAREHDKRDYRCVDCKKSFHRHPECLDFDHVPERGTKLACVSSLARMSPARLAAEVAKCDLVCANCHRKRTRRRREAA